VRGLVAHESATARRILAHALRSAGCDDVVTAPDGPRALAALEPAVDLVAASRTLPGLDGMELARRVRAHPGSSQAGILMVAGAGTRAEVEEAVAAGVNSYLLEPFTAEALAVRLARLVPAPDDRARAA